MTSSRTLRICAVLAATAFVIHGGGHVLRGTAHDLLWICNVAPVLLAAGALFENATAVAIATLWLGYGTPMWLLDLATGANMIVTSPLPHVLCPIVGVVAARKLGVPRLAWLRATAALVLVLVAARLLTPPEPNVNLVHAVWKGWETYFPRHDAYVLFGLVSSAFTFFVVERLLRLVAPSERAVS
jgi:hypothetical protein